MPQTVPPPPNDSPIWRTLGDLLTSANSPNSPLPPTANALRGAQATIAPARLGDINRRIVTAQANHAAAVDAGDTDAQNAAQAAYNVAVSEALPELALLKDQLTRLQSHMGDLAQLIAITSSQITALALDEAEL